MLNMTDQDAYRKLATRVRCAAHTAKAVIDAKKWELVAEMVGFFATLAVITFFTQLAKRDVKVELQAEQRKVESLQSENDRLRQAIKVSRTVTATEPGK